MKLKELKQLVAEEYNKYMSEQDPMDDMGLPTAAGAPADPTIAVSDKDINLDGGDEDAEATLRDIFNMLKDFFEGDDDKPAAPKAPKADKKDYKGDDKKDAPGGDEMPSAPKPPSAPAGGPAGPAGAPADMMALQERFKKLANIIK